MEILIKPLVDTFNKSTIKDLCSFFHRWNGVKHYMLASDYCINDDNRPNDVFSFVIFPNAIDFLTLKEIIRNVMSKDLKETNEIDKRAINLLNSGFVFALNFIFPKVNGKRALKTVEKGAVLFNIDKVIEMVNIWIKNEPEKEETYKLLIKKFKIFKSECMKKSFNIKLFVNIMICSTIAAYLCYIISKHSGIHEICWFSDRDNMSTYGNGILFDYFSIQNNGFEKNDTEYTYKSQLATTSPNETEGMWYDEIIRLPDYFAGSYSGFNHKTNEIMAKKYYAILNISKENTANILVQFINNIYTIQMARLVVETKII
jgi:hypothetical protein